MHKFLVMFLVLAVTLSCGNFNPSPVEPTTVREEINPSLAILPYPTYVERPTPVVIPATPTPVPMFYTVQPGDTLTEIALKYGLTVEYIAELNNIANVDAISADRVLILTGVPQNPTPTVDDGKQIIVDLSAQKVYVYQDGELLKTFLVSTGIAAYPTRLGAYKIWIKLEKTRMTGPGYDLPNVYWTMYFDQGRGFHAKYWNDIYGRPSSHGCINMRTEEAKWLYEWALVGTEVLVIP